VDAQEVSPFAWTILMVILLLNELRNAGSNGWSDTSTCAHLHSSVKHKTTDCAAFCSYNAANELWFFAALGWIIFRASRRITVWLIRVVCARQ